MDPSQLTKLRSIIWEMFEKRHSQLTSTDATPTGEIVPNTSEAKAITIIGDPLKDIELNTMVINPSMDEHGAVLHVNHGQQGHAKIQTHKDTKSTSNSETKNGSSFR